MALAEIVVLETRLKDLSLAVDGLFRSQDKDGRLVFGFEIPDERARVRDLARAVLEVR